MSTEPLITGHTMVLAVFAAIGLALLAFAVCLAWQNARRAVNKRRMRIPRGTTFDDWQRRYIP